MKNELTEFMAEEQTEPQEFKETLTAFMNKAAKLQEEIPFFEDSEEFKKIVEFFGPYFSIDKIEKVLSFYKNKLRALVENDIPLLLMGHGIRETTLEDGKKVKIDRVVSLTKKYIYDEKKLYTWLEKKGYSDALKMKYAFKKGVPYEEIEDYLKESSIDYERKEEIASQTLKKIMSDRIDEAEEMDEKERKKFEPLPPAKIAEVQIFNRAKII